MFRLLLLRVPGGTHSGESVDAASASSMSLPESVSERKFTAQIPTPGWWLGGAVSMVALKEDPVPVEAEEEVGEEEKEVSVAVAEAVAVATASRLVMPSAAEGRAGDKEEVKLKTRFKGTPGAGARASGGGSSSRLSTVPMEEHRSKRGTQSPLRQGLWLGLVPRKLSVGENVKGSVLSGKLL